MIEVDILVKNFFPHDGHGFQTSRYVEHVCEVVVFQFDHVLHVIAVHEILYLFVSDPTTVDENQFIIFTKLFAYDK